ncbi:MAG: PAC2 family protein [Candidatus Nanoarchaeia archaeon]|nr:PAC2 family protein [Candidatus Nanoarchaeia archaeon]MDD5053916.1 PAC2 family protein [Candidatus Nanoarchaeia archaeon]
MNEDFSVKWFSKKSVIGAELILGIPGIGNVANLSADYLIKKLKAELICRIESTYLPNIAIITSESLLMLPSYDLYFVSIKSKKIAFLKSNYAPINEKYNYELAEFLAGIIKKKGIKRVFTIAGIAYKEMPKNIMLHCAANDKKLVKHLKDSGLIFDGNKSVNLIIGSAGLLLTSCQKKGVPGACILASTFGHPQHMGIKEARKVIKFFSDYFKLNIDLSDIDKDIKKINAEIKKMKLGNQSNEDSSQRISRYIG